MSLLSGILAVVGVIGGIATGGVLGAVMIAASALSGLASNGVIGGSVGKFLNSGIGQGLLAAVTLGSAAYNQVASSALNASIGATANEAAGSLDSISQTVGGTVDADTQAIISSTQDASLMSDGLPVADVNAANTAASAATPGGDTAAIALQANSSQIAAQQTSSDLQATGSGGASGNIPAGASSATPAAGTPASAQQAVASGGSGGAATSTDPAAAANGGAAASPSTNTAADLPNSGYAEPTTEPPADNSSMLNKAEAWAKANPTMATGAAMVGGQLLSGVANGMAQNQMLNKQIAAANWGNTQWQNGTGVPQLQAAAAQPITVPQGYLSRANAVANLMQGNTSQNGPVSGVQPVGTTGSSASSGSVPVSALPGAGTLSQPMAPAGLQGTTPSAVVPRGGVA